MGNGADSGFVRSDRADIFYTLQGQGKPLVLLHGNSQSRKYLAHQIRDFRREYQVITIDSRGHGRSTLGFKRLSIPLMAGDVKAVLDHLQITRTAIMGFSDGANIGLQVAMMFPDLVSALVLISANLSPKGLKKTIRVPVSILYRFCVLLGGLSQWFDKKAQLLGLIVTEPNFEPENLDHILAKTLVIAGENDLIYNEHTRLIAQTIPQAKLKIIKRRSHNLLQSSYKMIDPLIASFLSHEY